MNQYKVNVTYTRLDANENTLTKLMSFVTSANSLEEARADVQEKAMPFINRVNGTLVSVE
jgi:hypothetical protein